MSSVERRQVTTLARITYAWILWKLLQLCGRLKSQNASRRASLDLADARYQKILTPKSKDRDPSLSCGLLPERPNRFNFTSEGVLVSLFRSTLVVKIQKTSKNPLRAFSVMPKKNNEDKENSFHRQQFASPLLVSVAPGGLPWWGCVLHFFATLC